jgi:hypothetical protein
MKKLPDKRLDDFERAVNTPSWYDECGLLQIHPDDLRALLAEVREYRAAQEMRDFREEGRRS